LRLSKDKDHRDEVDGFTEEAELLLMIERKV
jgi:hypothetical protein